MPFWVAEYLPTQLVHMFSLNVFAQKLIHSWLHSYYLVVEEKKWYLERCQVVARDNRDVVLSGICIYAGIMCLGQVRPLHLTTYITCPVRC